MRKQLIILPGLGKTMKKSITLRVIVLMSLILLTTVLGCAHQQKQMPWRSYQGPITSVRRQIEIESITRYDAANIVTVDGRLFVGKDLHFTADSTFWKDLESDQRLGLPSDHIADIEMQVKDTLDHPVFKILQAWGAFQEVASAFGGVGGGMLILPLLK